MQGFGAKNTLILAYFKKSYNFAAESVIKFENEC